MHIHIFRPVYVIGHCNMISVSLVPLNIAKMKSYEALSVQWAPYKRL